VGSLKWKTLVTLDRETIYQVAILHRMTEVSKQEGTRVRNGLSL